MHAEPYLNEARQATELTSAEGKALNPAYMQCDGMDDMGDYFEEFLAQHKLCTQHAQMQAGLGGRS